MRPLAPLAGLLAAMSVASAQSVDLAAPGPKGELRGTYLQAGEGAPVVLIVPGSGPTDRDGNSPLGVRAAPYRLLAEGLADRGIASIRIDKRGMFGSAGAVTDPNAVKVADYVADTHAWIAVARHNMRVDCVWLAGHSEGALIALAAAQRPDGICGLFLIAGPGRRLGDVLRAQLAVNPHNRHYMDDLLGAIDTLERGGDVETTGKPEVIWQLFAPQVQGYLRDLFSYDPAALIRAVDLPVLIVQGGNDLQITTEDADRLAAALPAARRLDLPTMNHVLKDVPDGDLAANIGSYGDPERRLAKGLVEGVAAFVKGAG